MTGSPYFLATSQAKEDQLIRGIDRVLIFVITADGGSFPLGRHSRDAQLVGLNQPEQVQEVIVP